MDVQLILDADNASVSANVLGRSVSRLDGAPLGVTGDGEVGAKVIVVAGGTSGGGSGIARTIAISTVTTSGSVAAGKVGIEFIFSEDFMGTIDGEAFDGSVDVFYSPPPLPSGDTYAALSYTVSAGSFRLSTLA